MAPFFLAPSEKVGFATAKPALQSIQYSTHAPLALTPIAPNYL